MSIKLETLTDDELREIYNPESLRYCNYSYLTDENIIFELTLLLYFQGGNNGL